jgi:hypothetical protein
MRDVRFTKRVCPLTFKKILVCDRSAVQAIDDVCQPLSYPVLCVSEQAAFACLQQIYRIGPITAAHMST